MSERNVNGTTLDCVLGDIADQPDVEAVVNAANAALRTGGGVAGAIHRAAGPGLEAECRPLAPLRPGQAVITGAHGLPNRHVIHCLGPVFGRDEPASRHLASCYRNALHLAEKHNIASIAFPAISTGAFAYPFDLAIKVALKTIIQERPHLASVRLIRFVLFDPQDVSLFSRILEDFADDGTQA